MIGAIGGHAIASGAIGSAATASRVSPLTATTYRFPGPIARYAIAGTVIGAGPSATYYVYLPSGEIVFSGDALAYRQTTRIVRLSNVRGYQTGLTAVRGTVATMDAVHGSQPHCNDLLGSVPTLHDLTGRQPTLTGVGHG